MFFAINRKKNPHVTTIYYANVHFLTDLSNSSVVFVPLRCSVVCHVCMSVDLKCVKEN